MSQENTDRPRGSRMLVEPDSIHEMDGGLYFDCPQCGSNISVARIINKGRCSGQLDGHAAETAADTDIENDCTAKLSLELVWKP